MEEHLNIETTLFEPATTSICSVLIQLRGRESVSEVGEVQDNFMHDT